MRTRVFARAPARRCDAPPSTTQRQARPPALRRRRRGCNRGPLFLCTRLLHGLCRLHHRGPTVFVGGRALSGGARSLLSRTRRLRGRKRAQLGCETSLLDSCIWRPQGLRRALGADCRALQTQRELERAKEVVVMLARSQQGLFRLLGLATKRKTVPLRRRVSACLCSRPLRRASGRPRLGFKTGAAAR